METGKLARTLALVVASLSAHAFAQTIEPASLPTEVEQIRRNANQGDYNAQRNLAYTYATGQGLSGQKSPKAACAWYLAIPYLNPKKANAGDSGNVWLYCQKLSPTDFDEAVGYSVALVGKLKK